MARKKKILKVCLACVLSIVLLSCTTPPPVRKIPPEMSFESQKRKVIAKTVRQTAENGVNITNTLLNRLGDEIGYSFRIETLAAIESLRQAIKGDKDDEIHAKTEELSDRYLRLSDLEEMIKKTTYLPFDLGDMLSPSLMLQLIAEINALQKSIKVDSWDEIQKKYSALNFDSKIALLRRYQGVLGNIAKLGIKLGPSLRDQVLRGLEPLQKAMKGDSWDDLLAKSTQLPDIVFNPEYLLKYIEEGERKLEAYDSNDLEFYLSKRKDLYFAMQWDNWQLVMDKAAGLRPEYLIERYQKSGSCVRVLSIDGGGIRGIIPAMILSVIEERTKKPIAQMFDLIVGTSTGGILALGLTKPHKDDLSKPAYEAKDLVELYKNNGEKIFPQDPLKGVRQLLAPKYSAKGIEDVLESYFGDTCFGEALTNVAIPVYEVEAGKHFFFWTYQVQMHHVYMREVARAASAAPTYFPPLRVPIPVRFTNQKDKDYAALIDGGVFANNPSHYAVLIANYFEYESQNKPHDKDHPLFLLSLGTGRVTFSKTFEDALNWGLPQWASPLIDIAFSDPGVEDEFDVLVKWEDFSSRLQADILTEEASKLDNASKSNLQQLEYIANELIDKKKDEINQIVELLLKERPSDCKRHVGPYLSPYPGHLDIEYFLKQEPYVP